jgi:hypothetical protein
MKKSKSQVTEEPEEIRKGGPEDTFQISVSRRELDTLYNAVRALELIRALDDEEKVVVTSVLLENFADPAWEAVAELQGRFRDQELRAAGFGPALDRLEQTITNRKGGAA